MELTQWPVAGSCRPEDAGEHADSLMKDFEIVNMWLKENCEEFSIHSTRSFKKCLALGVRHGVVLGLEDVSQGIHPKVDKEFVKEVIEREVAKELSKGLGPGVPKVFFDQLYKSYIELNRKLVAKDGSTRAYDSRMHQRLPKRLPRASTTPCSSRNVLEKHAGQDGEQILLSDDAGTRGWPKDSETSSELPEDHGEESFDRCCICGTLNDQEEHIITACCLKSVGSLCFEEAMQETGKCCLCHKTQSHFESGPSIEQSEQEPNYKFHFVETHNQAEDSRKDKSITGTFDQLEKGAACPSWEGISPFLVPGKSAEPIKCPGEFSKWEARRPEARKLEGKLPHGTGSFSNVRPEPSKISHEDSSIHSKLQCLDPPESNPMNPSITKEYELVLRLSDQAVISHLKSLSRDDVLATVSEALEERLSTTIHTTPIFGILLLESGVVQFKYGVKKGQGPDLGGGAASLAETLEIFVRARLKPYLVEMHNIQIKSMNLCNEVQRTRAIEELVRSNTDFMQYLNRPDDIRTIRWTTNKKRRGTIQVDSVTLGLATAAQANEIIARGLSWNGIRRCCVKHVPKQNIMQCYNCQNFGHIAKTCTTSPRCRECAGCHQSKNCPLGFNASPKSLKCALCGGPHCAKYYYCPVRSGEEIRLQVENRFYPTDADNRPAASATR